MTLILGTQAQNYRVPIDRGTADLAYLIGAAAIWSTFFVSFLTSFSQCREKRVLGHLMFLTLGVVGTTFLIFFYRATPQLVGFQGHPVDLARMIEWTRSCPALALLIGHVTRASPNKIWRAEVNSFILMVFGTLAAITKEPWSEIHGIMAVSFHYMAMYDLYDMFGDAIAGKTGSKYDALSLQWARGATMFSW